MTHPWFAPADRPRILAHRGLAVPDADGHAPAENSFAAVAAAHAIGADYVESDCHVTADGVVVLFHDVDLRRVTGDPRPVADVTAAELERLMAHHGGLLTLRQALESFPTVRFNLDVKADAAALPVGRLVGAHADRVLLTSFSDGRRRAALEAAVAASGGARPATSAGSATIARLLGALVARSRRGAARLLDGIDALQIPERQGRLRVLSPRLVAAAHSAGTEVHVWTVNDPADMTRLVALGVDGIVTDRADLAIAAFRR
ncbi:glycerophosphodiester phosphodiesterase family protein [Microbacterium terricola]|uniref:Glycerophosphoryl diester phosphodiesterase n=1 Tax=Microbacterium terricola TaxID=344163 RepID=A0ABM8DXX3_9MICO|nr:glycerophosphodiester phosphodiesterase family protein [Microbacterium terricola]UYK38779.1 glycerophosphodiester phosphodiesterase family protein [Microbacterium terricola]BDV30528.1 glycerophosphoryl diester phosphodiesterase [Microbacterium terricola]